MAWRSLGQADDIPPGQARGFDPRAEGRNTLFVANLGGQLRGWRDWCPHWQTGPMAWRKDAYISGDGEALMCHAHGARFDPVTGVCTLGPCLGERLQPIALRRKPDGQLEADLDGLPPNHE